MIYQEEEVRRGMSLLDAKKPGWRNRFDPTILDMGHYERCALGQAYGTYATGLSALGFMAHEQAVEYGFNIPTRVETKFEMIENFSHLTSTWRTLFEATQAQS